MTALPQPNRSSESHVQHLLPEVDHRHLCLEVLQHVLNQVSDRRHHALADHNVVPLAPVVSEAVIGSARAGLREAEHRHRQVREAAAIVLQTLHARLDLVQLQRDGARHEGGGGRDGGNDLARDLLDGVAIDRGDAVTTR